MKRKVSLFVRGPLRIVTLFTFLGLFAMMCSTFTIVVIQSLGTNFRSTYDVNENIDLTGYHGKNILSHKSNFDRLSSIQKESTDSDIVTRQRMMILEHNRPPDERYNFNVTASDVLPCNRDIPDTRSTSCHGRTDNPDDRLDNLQASVIVPFFNEALSVLLRTVQSVLTRTPDRYLKEIILVDDASTYSYLRDSRFDRYWRHLPKVNLVRLTERQGLIRSRLHGADLASGDVLIFLDAHVECNVGWVEPLLIEISQNRKTIVQPFIDGIDPNSMEYSGPTVLTKSAFTWDLRYVWMEIPEHQQTLIHTQAQPFPSPALVGCSFAVAKTFFFDIGAFDPSFQIWGGENIELAFRAWMCGGNVMTVPCSRVGHLFKDIPYPNDVSRENAWLRNLARVSEVWMDGFKKYFHASIGVHDPQFVRFNLDSDQAIQERKRLRKQLNCKTFEWYLHNVIPELPIPSRDAAYHGEIINQRSSACWEITDDGHVTINFRCYQHKIITQNFFTLTAEGLLIYRDKCVKFLFPTPSLVVHECPHIRDIQQFGVWSMRMRNEDRKWGQLQVTLTLKHEVKTWCIEHLTSAVSPHKNQQMAQTAPRCDDNNMFQFWSFTYRFKYD